MAQTYKGEKLAPNGTMLGILQRNALKLAEKAKKLVEQAKKLDAEIDALSKK